MHSQEINGQYDTSFIRDTIQGLSAFPKSLQSKYFYDDRGSIIFQQIMNLDDYYLTNSETEIFEKYSREILRYIIPNKDFHLIELGCGDGIKTKILLEHLVANHTNFTFVPIDISELSIQSLSDDLRSEIPNLKIEPYIGDYLETLDRLHNDKNFDTLPRMVLFLGSNLGNFSHSETNDFLSRLSGDLNEGDQFLIGLDLVKNPHTIRRAYDDSEGITKEFNLNLLRRMNLELGSNFDLKQFEHYTYYDIRNQEVLSFLVSTQDQDVQFESFDKIFHFEKWEKIFMERSHKYTLEDINILAQTHGFEILENFLDSREYFCNSLWRKR
ncbi:MAG: L-histidine N(alpha)-methyltransferase [Leptospira sp.]|nr:L-histidine N(alpha)-methyltransferase [Leptospira sp.]